MKYIIIFLALFSYNTSFAKSGKMIVTTLPELKWVVDELSKDLKDIKSISLLSGNEDPHFVDATPGLILKVSKADLVVANGLQLEIGWLPKVIQMASNSKVQFNSTGHCDSSSYVEKLQVIKNYDRSMGDIHPVGNPHYTLSIAQMKNVAKKISECLVALMPEYQKQIQINQLQLQKKLSEKMSEISKKMSKLKKHNLMTYHREFVYYFSDIGLNSIGSLEKVPGVLPSASHLYKITEIAKKEDVKLALASLTNPRKYLAKFNELTNISFVQLPLHLSSKFKDYWEFQEFISDEILKNVKSN
jgi:zinc/manganese transport system substrate-binding protein